MSDRMNAESFFKRFGAVSIGYANGEALALVWHKGGGSGVAINRGTALHVLEYIASFRLDNGGAKSEGCWSRPFPRSEGQESALTPWRAPETG